MTVPCLLPSFGVWDLLDRQSPGLCGVMYLGILIIFLLFRDSKAWKLITFNANVILQFFHLHVKIFPLEEFSTTPRPMSPRSQHCLVTECPHNSGSISISFISISTQRIPYSPYHWTTQCSSPFVASQNSLLLFLIFCASSAFSTKFFTCYIFLKWNLL